MSGGTFLSIVGAVITIASGGSLAWIGVPLMIGGGIWAAYDARMAAKAAMEKAAKERQGMKTNTRTSQRPIPVVYGECRVGSNLVYAHFGGPVDSDGVQRNRYLYMIHGVSEGPIEQFRGVWINDTKVWQATSGMTDIQSGYLDTKLKPYIYFNFRNGCSSQDWFHEINSISPLGTPVKRSWMFGLLPETEVTVEADVDKEFNDRFTCTAVCLTRFLMPEPDYGNQRYEPPWQGIPTVTFDVLGKRVRNINDDINAYTWSDNPAHVLYDVMTEKRYGWGIPSSKIDLSSFQGVSSFTAGSGDTYTGETNTMIDVATEGKPYGYIEMYPVGATSSPYTFAYTTGSANGILANSITRLPTNPGSIRIEVNGRVNDQWGNFSGNAKWIYYADSAGAIYSSAVNNPAWWMATSDTGNGPVPVFITPPFLAGSVDFATGQITIDPMYEYAAVTDQEGYGGWVNYADARSIQVNFFSNWGLKFTAGNEWLVSNGVDMTVWDASSNAIETFSETSSGSGIFLGNNGGWAKVNYSGGDATIVLGEQPAGTANLSFTYATLAHRGYQYNGILYDSQAAADVVKDICAHFRGYLTYTQGVYKLNVDKTGTPVYAFDDDNIKAGSFTINQTPISERPNRVRVKYTDRALNYAQTDVIFEPVDPVIPLDVAVNEHTISLPALVYRDQAHRMAQTLGLQAQLGNTCEFITGQMGLAIEPGDLVTVTHPSAGWIDKIMRVIETEEFPNEEVKLSCVEYDANVYVDEYTSV